MINQSPWQSLRSGNVKHGLDLMREGYRGDPSASHIMQLGVGYLWVQDYLAAREHFQEAVERYPRSMSSFYGMAGVAHWCIDEPAAAVKCWQLGLNAEYADAAGGIHLPLLLFVASILKPASSSRNEAEQLLKKKTRDPRVKNWPGPLAKFVLNGLNQEALEDLSKEQTKREISPYRKWLIRFYKDVLDLGRGDLKSERFKKQLELMVDTKQPEWLDEKNFVHLVWNEEFFIARYEAFLR